MCNDLVLAMIADRAIADMSEAMCTQFCDCFKLLHTTTPLPASPKQADNEAFEDSSSVGVHCLDLGAASGSTTTGNQYNSNVRI